MKRRASSIVVAIAVILTTICIGCKETNRIASLPQTDISFWGDSTTVLISDKLHNGYKISIFKNKGLYFFHFERGDSINWYCEMDRLPDELKQYERDSVGVFEVDMDFPILRVDSLYDSSSIPDMFFMDVNFDGEEEFIVEIYCHSMMGYTCFDLINRYRDGSRPALLEPMQDEPFDQIVSTIDDAMAHCYTVFDREKKEIFIHQTSGCCKSTDTWAKCIEGVNFKVTKCVEHSYESDKMRIVTYELQNDTLKVVSDENVDYGDE